MSLVTTMPTVQSYLPPRRNRSNHSTNSSYTSGAKRTRKSRRRNLQHRTRQKELSLEKYMNAANTTNEGQSKNRKSNAGKNARTNDQGLDTNSEPKGRSRKTRKVYRKTKVLRTWVLPVLFLVPVGMIWLEYSIGKLIGLEDIRNVYEEQLVDPWNLLMQDLNASRVREKSTMGIPPLSPSLLPNISYAPRTQCPPGQRRMINVHNPISHSIGSGRRLIPMIVHQQSKTRCLTMKVDRATTKWAFRRWSYYIHDEDSKSRLFDRYCGGATPKCEFPLLSQIVTKCFCNQNNTRNQLRYYSLKIELWKFLTLWIFGGVYVDLDFLPMKFTPTTIEYDDGFLLIDSDTQMLSTKLMAVSPRHPIMYYAVHHLLLNILMEESSSSLVGTTTIAQKSTANNTEFESAISGSSILSQAFRMFQEGHKLERDSSNFSPGLFHGVMNRTVRVVATSGLNIEIHTDDNGSDDDSDQKENALVMSIFGSEKEKEVEYQKMEVTVDEAEEVDANSAGENGVTLSCLDELYHLAGVPVSV